MTSHPISMFLAALVAMLAGVPALAASWTWDNGAYQNATTLGGTYIGTGQWSNNTNWVGNGTTPPAGGPNNVADDVTFNQYLDNPQQVVSGSVSGTAVNVLWIKNVANSGSTFNVNSITFTGTSPKYLWAIKPTVTSTITTAQNVQLNGGGLTMAAGSGPAFVGNSNNFARAPLNIRLNTTGQSIVNNSASDLTFGTADYTPYNAQTLVGGNNSTNIRGAVILGSTAAGTPMIVTMNAGSTGNIVLNGNFTNNTSGLQVVVNNTGSGQFIVSGNIALNSANLLNLPNPSGLRVLGGTLLVSGSYDGSTTFTVNNNTEIATGASIRITRSGALPLGTPATSGGGTLVYDGGSGSVLQVSGSLGHTGGTTVSSGTLQLASGATLGTGNIAVASGARLDVNQSSPNPTLTYSGTISGAGQLTKFGSGTFALTGNNSFTGGITAGDGVLSVAQLDVSRLITGTAPGTLAVAGAGTLDVSTANNAGGLAFRLGTASDLVTVASGNLQIGNGLLNFNDFTFTAGSGFGQGSYTLFSSASLLGALGSSTSGTVGGLPASLQVSGNSILLSVVPEPSLTAALIAGLGMGGLILRRRQN